ncbi:MAG: 1,4-alpha-glucan branching protein GlgB [Chitinophagia bacterium]|jgi:1,4-alpha-glucan branching enzyme|nr:1,4-alpha-glucan branching protein GlgB [Chitinophagia bacterium]
MPKYEELHFVDTKQAVWNYSLFTDEDVRNFQNGTHYSLYTLFGNKQLEVSGTKGTYFAVWAPNATAVYVKGNFNDWNNETHLLKVRQDSSGIWEGFVPGIHQGEVYKYHIHGYKGVKLDKGDPFANYWELRPLTASITWQTNYAWKDAKWIEQRKIKNRTDQPYSVYEVHLASWMRPNKNDENSYNSYIQLIDLLVPYVKEMGFTHVEFMPVMEHPFDGSWGYQGVGFFAPTSRFGNPQEFAALVEAFHVAEIGVIVDWVPSHFPYDAHGLFMFDGNNTYEYADMRKGYHPDWNSYIFNYKRGEVKSFLISSARFWCDQFHIDGLRVDAVSSMLRLDYSRELGEWEPNEFGGNGNIEAIAFIKDLNETLYRDFPYIQTIAEEASDWPGISKPTFMNGLGFGMKWMMGWMHDTLDYFKLDPLFRSLQQDKFSFSMMYFYDESFMLPLSHDEVVHGKSPLIYKMPGDDWQKFANLRLLFTYMFMHPGAKLLFMGNEFAATKEWNYTTELQWDLLNIESHAGMRRTVQALNEIYKNNPALYELQFNPKGFEWVELNKREEVVIAFKRKGLKTENDILVVMNMTPVPRHQFPIYVEGKKKWREIFNSDAKKYGGAGDLTNTSILAYPQDEMGNWNQLLLNLPALSAIVLG